jgi:hypothetical protein
VCGEVKVGRSVTGQNGEYGRVDAARMSVVDHAAGRSIVHVRSVRMRDPDPKQRIQKKKVERERGSGGVPLLWYAT